MCMYVLLGGQRIATKNDVINNQHNYNCLTMYYAISFKIVAVSYVYNGPGILLFMFESLDLLKYSLQSAYS